MSQPGYMSNRQYLPDHVFIERGAPVPVAFPALKAGMNKGPAKGLSCYPPDVHAYALNAERCVCSDTERPKRSA